MDKVVEKWVTTSKPLESRGLWKRFVQERNQILPQAKPSKSISDKYQDYLKAESYLEPKSQMFVRDEMGFDKGGLATPKRGLVDEPGSYGGFDIDFYKDKKTSELNKAAKYYTKGKITKFKNLTGPEYKIVRGMVNKNLERNKGKFRDPNVSKKDRFEDSYKTIQKFIKKFKNKTNRLPSKVEIAKGTGFHVQGSIEAGEKKGLFKTYKGIPPEAAKAGAEKRAVLQTKTAKTATVPILRKSGPGKPVEQVIFPDKKIGNKTYRQAFIDDLKLRYKYPMMSKEAKAAGVLSDAQMMKKYGIPSQKSLGQYIFYTNKFEGITAASPIKSSKELLKTSQEYRDVLKAQQGKVFIPRGLHGTAESGTHLQHAMLKNPKLPITAENLVFIPARMNTKYVKNIETLRNNITAERDKLLKNKPKDWIKRVETLNNQGIDLAAQTDGIVQFESIDHKGNKYVHKLGSEKYQLDVAGLNKDKLLKDYTKADWDILRLNVNTARTAGSKLSSADLGKNIKQLAQGLNKILECKLEAGVNCDDPMSYYKSLKEQEQIAAKGKGPNKIKAINKVRAAKNLLYGTIGPYALAVEGAIAGPLAGYEFLQGALPSEILNTATYGIAGKDRDEIIQEGSSEEIFKPRDFMETGERLESLYSDPITGGYRGRYDRIGAIEDTKKKFRDQYYDSYFAHPKTGDFSESIFNLRLKEQQAEEAKYQKQRDQLKQERADKYTNVSSGFDLPEFAGGGIAGVRRPHAIPPKSGPMPQGGGLSSMFNRVRKW